MTESAILRRLSTAERIHRYAQVLTDERGLDGFTMDELAQDAEVSRRTLFNYYPSKIDAVLGEWPLFDDDDVDEFRAGGPDGDLINDLYALVRGVLEIKVSDREVLERGRRIMLKEPRLMTRAHARYQELSAEIIEHIEVRQGTTFVHAQVAVSILGAIFDASLESFLRDDRDRPFTEHFDENLTAARQLLGAV